MFVGNVLTLSSVDTEHFIDHIALCRFDTFETHELVEVDRTIGDTITRFDDITVSNRQLTLVWDLVASWRLSTTSNDQFTVTNLDSTVKRCNKWH